MTVLPGGAVPARNQSGFARSCMCWEVSLEAVWGYSCICQQLWQFFFAVSFLLCLHLRKRIRGFHMTEVLLLQNLPKSINSEQLCRSCILDADETCPCSLAISELCLPESSEVPSAHCWFELSESEQRQNAASGFLGLVLERLCSNNS